MLKFSKKHWFIVLGGVFLIGFLIGYLTITWDFYQKDWRGLNFWQILSPF